MSTRGHREWNSRHWGLERGGEWGGGMRNYLVGTTYTNWVKVTQKAQIPLLWNIPM